MKQKLVRSQLDFLQLCVDAGTVFAEKCRQALLEGGMARLDLVRSAFSPTAYHTVQDFEVDYLIYSYISKLQFREEDERLDAECLQSFLETERRNAEWNRKLRQVLPDKGAEELIFAVRRKVASVFGAFEHHCLEWRDLCDWGPGATYSLKAKDATLDKKITEKRISITPRAIPYFRGITTTDYHWFYARTGVMPAGPTSWAPCEFEVVKGERFDTAPKKWDRKRTISIQPTGNLFLQKGMGAYLRKRLKRRGIDLDDQTRNKSLASSAYVKGFATLDLKEASNSVLVELVRLYVEPDWVDLLEDLRCPFVQLPDGSWHTLALHSAMGGGYTFELETLLFWAIASSVAELRGFDPSSVSVYGDDVIVPKECAEEVIRVFEANGLRINKDKTFVSGLFFESCGGHYFRGCDVTPIYEKKTSDKLEDCIRSFNRLYRWCKRTDRVQQFRRTLLGLELKAYQALEREEQRRARVLRRQTGSSKRRPQTLIMPVVPITLTGDFGLVSDDPARWTVKRVRQDVWTFQTWSSLPLSKEGNAAAVYSDNLKREVRERAVYGLVSPRDQVRWRMSEVRALRGPDFQL